ncbi:MAG: ElyC/SanA/YdcF family protein, partial [Rhodospirillaceae bacterium]
GWRRVLLVTDDFHMPRALMCFQGLGMDAAGDAVPAALSVRTLAARFREVFARLHYARLIRAHRNRGT